MEDLTPLLLEGTARYKLVSGTVAVGFLIAVALCILLPQKKKNTNDDVPWVRGGIPMLGHVVPFSLKTKQFLFQCQEEYGGAFCFRLLDKIIVILDANYCNAFYAAKTTEMSFYEAMRHALALQYTVGLNVIDDPWHKPLLKTQFSPKGLQLQPYYFAIESQAQRVLQEELMDSNNNSSVIHDDMGKLAWKCFAAATAVSFLGKDLGERPDILEAFQRFPAASEKVIQAHAVLPQSALWMFSRDVNKYKCAIRKAVIPEVERRLETCGKSDDWPPDFLSAIIRANKHSKEEIVARLIALIQPSMITTSNFLMHFLWDMAAPGRGADTSIKQTLLEEQRQVVKTHGSNLSHEALVDMPQLTSFFYESARLSSLPILNIRWTLSDAVRLTSNDKKQTIRLPANAIVGLSPLLLSNDETLFANPETFQYDRFLDKQTGRLLHISKQTDNWSFFEMHLFGKGKHRCPGMHFAMAGILGPVAILLRNYEMEIISGKVPEYKISPAAVDRVREPVRFTPRSSEF